MTANDPASVAAQYATDQHLRTRRETHQHYGVGPDLEAVVDAALALKGGEALLDVGTGPGDYPGRLRARGHSGLLVGADLSAGMVNAARQNHPGMDFRQASADALPFADASFDVLTARHMLYHVPDVPAALAEFQRVLKPGGRLLAVTNAARYLGELWDAVAEAAALEPGLLPLSASQGSVASTFSEVNGAAWIAEVFGNVQVINSDSALVFPAAEPALAYLASSPAWQNFDDAQRVRSGAVLRQVLADRLRNGPWRVSKRTVLLQAARS